jgi:hypothetical protein
MSKRAALCHAINTGSVFVAVRKMKQNILKGKQTYFVKLFCHLCAYAFKRSNGCSGQCLHQAISFFWNINYLTFELAQAGVIQHVIGKEV